MEKLHRFILHITNRQASRLIEAVELAMESVSKQSDAIVDSKDFRHDGPKYADLCEDFQSLEWTWDQLAKLKNKLEREQNRIRNS